ncbi:uncharacterized protein [Pocillopora verrucosa]|uniref:uncharacterized protein n=1 Tax=Pocillopora verrucosa TaxID=203993 RepID=UPI0033415DF3
MMKIRLCTLKCLVILLGVASLMTIAGRNLYQESFVTEDSNIFKETQVAKQFFNPLGTSCKPEPLLDSIARLNGMFDDLKTFVMFIGYSQTIESRTGAILDAHPQIILPQEYDVLGNWKMYQNKKLRERGKQKYMLFFFLHYLSTFQAIFRNQANKSSQFWVWTSKVESARYYPLSDTWQGITNGKIKVIGDTSSGSTTRQLTRNQGNFTVLEDIQNVIGIPLKFLHTITNPYEVIALNVMRQSRSAVEINDAKDVFALVETNAQIRKLYGDAVLDISTDDYINNPRETMIQICRFLQVTCYNSYLDKVEKELNKESTRARDQVIWTDEEKEWVAAEINKYSFLKSFEF